MKLKIIFEAWQGEDWQGKAGQGKARQGVWRNYKPPLN